MADDDGRHDLLTQFRLTLLDGGHDHVTGTGGRETVKTSTAMEDGDDVKVLCTRVVSAVENSASWKTDWRESAGKRGKRGYLRVIRNLLPGRRVSIK